MSAGTNASAVVVGVQLAASGTLPNKADCKETRQGSWKFNPVIVTLTALVLTCVLGRTAKTIGGGGVATDVDVGVLVGVGVSVGDAVGVSVGTGVGVSVGTNVLVAVGRLMDVGVGLAAGVGVGTLAGVAIGVAVGVAVGVAIGVAVGVGGSSTMDNGVLLAETGVRAN